MGNIRHWLEAAEVQFEEPIEAIVVGQHDRVRWGTEPQADENIILSREAGLLKLDQDYHDGYGSADCYPMYAWSASRVFFIGEYDGSTFLGHVPRNPVAQPPVFGGE